MRAFVIGGAGFIGSYLVRLLLEKDYAVRVYDNLVRGNIGNVPATAHFINGDILDHRSLCKSITDYDPDVIFHLDHSQ